MRSVSPGPPAAASCPAARAWGPAAWRRAPVPPAPAAPRRAAAPAGRARRLPASGSLRRLSLTGKQHAVSCPTDRLVGHDVLEVRIRAKAFTLEVIGPAVHDEVRVRRDG